MAKPKSNGTPAAATTTPAKSAAPAPTPLVDMNLAIETAKQFEDHVIANLAELTQAADDLARGQEDAGWSKAKRVGDLAGSNGELLRRWKRVRASAKAEQVAVSPVEVMMRRVSDRISDGKYGFTAARRHAADLLLATCAIGRDKANLAREGGNAKIEGQTVAMKALDKVPKYSVGNDKGAAFPTQAAANAAAKKRETELAGVANATQAKDDIEAHADFANACRNVSGLRAYARAGNALTKRQSLFRASMVSPLVGGIVENAPSLWLKACTDAMNAIFELVETSLKEDRKTYPTVAAVEKVARDAATAVCGTRAVETKTERTPAEIEASAKGNFFRAIDKLATLGVITVGQRDVIEAHAKETASLSRAAKEGTASAEAGTPAEPSPQAPVATKTSGKGKGKAKGGDAATAVAETVAQRLAREASEEDKAERNGGSDDAGDADLEAMRARVAALESERATD